VIRRHVSVKIYPITENSNLLVTFLLLLSQADQSGTIAEILVEDGKPVSVDLVRSLFALSISLHIYVCVRAIWILYGQGITH
jgi:hypothetical protein